MHVCGAATLLDLVSHLLKLVGAIIGVRTSGMYTVVMCTPSSMTSGPIERENASSAALEAT